MTKPLTTREWKGIQDCLESLVVRISKRERTTLQAGLRDLVTVARHLAEKMNLDIEQAIEGSGEVYEEETSS